ncbi:MAG TPA: hypothetical protein VLT87_25815 [Thermoanaerobaculia bacterium]|nr:hypothetical protein [Thermoanaerobaculia bacterium]
MLTAPAFTQIEGVTVFADDALFYKFYPIAQAPNVRLDGGGDPIFLLVKYAFSDEDRQSRPALPSGGGYLNFDVSFEVPADQLERVRTALQPGVDAEWQRLQGGTPQERARPGVVGTTEPPRVELGTPTWTGGKVALDAPQAAELVSARVSEATPSLLDGNIAVFNMDLTPAGATFMEKTLLTPGGAGASDLSPLQVAYDLKFWARLPPVRIHIKADSQKVHTYIHKQLEGRGIDHCTTYDFDHTDIAHDTTTLSGLIDVQIDTGSGSLPDEVIEELRNYALELVKQMIESSFFTATPPEEQDEEPARDTGRPATNNSKKYLKQRFDNATMSLQLDLEQRSVVEWQIHPQATLETFFKGRRPEEMKQFVRVIDLDDDFFKSLELTVRAFTDFADRAVSNVEVEVRYEGRDENGHEVEKGNTFTLTSNAPETWKVSRIGDEREYRYRYRVGFTGQDAGSFTDWAASTSPDLNVSVPNPGRVSVDVLAGDVDFANLVENVQVRLAYEDLERGVAREEHTLVLTPTRTEDRYQRLILTPRRKPVRYRTRFKLKSGEVREDDAWRDADGQQILINQSFHDLLRVSLLPAGDGWDDVVQVMVDLRYEDAANHYTAEETVLLKSREELKSWKVFLKNPALRSFRYRWTAAFKSGQLQQSDWQTSTGEETLPIVLKRPGFRVLILADTLDFAACPVTEATFRYAAAGVDRQETFVFLDKKPQVWNVTAPLGAPVEFTYRVTHNPVGRDPLVLPEARETDTVVVLPTYRPSRSGRISVQVLANLVDFAATPIVTLDFRYDDEDNGVHESGSLTFTDKTSQTWAIDVKDINQRRYGCRLTYFTADGGEHAGDLKLLDAARFIIPRFAA